MRSSRLLVGALGAAGVLLATACGYSPTPVPTPTPTAAATSAPAPPAAPTCDNATQSYDPLAPMPAPGAIPEGSTMAEIQERGRLIVGGSADSFLLASRNPQTGDIEGFDVDMARSVAEAIFGDPERIQFKVITAADRIPVLESGEVDIVVRNMTMTCGRWEQIGFSAEYYRSGQKILVRQGSDITGLDTLAGHRVCAPNGTSSMDNLIRLVPEAVPVGSSNHTGCLVLFQRGDVDAITGDDTVLAGLAAQDPYAVVLEGEPFTEEPYGIGVPAEDTDLAVFVNGVLEQMRTDGRWSAAYDRWLAPTLGAGSGQPTPVYGRG
ncbi:MAG: glutamate ABC transporter substrate-binding protein [Intrasporangiaceae bacterium]|nr:glutamate ABC transporter substrate-binding protein [Intrasporangiaceae bacterium]